MSICWSVGEHVSFDKSLLRVTAVFEALDVNKDVRDPLPVTGLQMVCSATWYTDFHQGVLFFQIVTVSWYTRKCNFCTP